MKYKELYMNLLKDKNQDFEEVNEQLQQMYDLKVQSSH